MGENMVLHDHIDAISHCYAPALNHFFLLIIPLRDPLASIITKHAREPETWPYRSHIENWRLCADMLSRGIGHVVTVDNDPDWVAVSRHVGISESNPPEKINVSQKTALHQAYDEGDRLFLKRELNEVWFDLQKLEPMLRPHLERYGYRDLLWWS